MGKVKLLETYVRGLLVELDAGEQAASQAAELYAAALKYADSRLRDPEAHEDARQMFVTAALSFIQKNAPNRVVQNAAITYLEMDFEDVATRG